LPVEWLIPDQFRADDRHGAVSFEDVDGASTCPYPPAAFQLARLRRAVPGLSSTHQPDHRPRGGGGQLDCLALKLKSGMKPGSA